ncbi:hypothetical protein P3S68_024947 [Capsicum galapagoense]
MDSTMYNAAMRGNIRDANFLLADHLKKDEENGHQVTPKGNTVLNVAALYAFMRGTLRGWNLLHYAVKLGLAGVVSDMLRWKKSLVYLPAGSENDWTTAIHIAASEGDVNMIRNLLNHCPDCCDMLNSNNQNALHVASLNSQDEVVRFLLDSDKCGSLVDEPDRDGNTPLHLFAASGNHLPELINHPRAKKMSFNKENQTPLDIALSCTATTKKRDFEVKRTYEYMPLREDDHDKAEKADQTVIEIIMKSDQFHIVVATLIMTITFAAGITLPGGFESDPDSPNKGMEILIRKTTFLAFVVSNAIAFTFSSIAIFIYFIMASVVPEPENEKIIQKLYDHAAICQCLSMLAVVIAFATGMFATLSHSLGLAITVYSISCLSIFFYFLVFIYIARKL